MRSTRSGHRNVRGLAWHSAHRQLWATEIGPIGQRAEPARSGHNYGWPLVRHSARSTPGTCASDQPSWSRPTWTTRSGTAMSPSSLMSGDQLPTLARPLILPISRRRNYGESMLLELDARAEHGRTVTIISRSTRRRRCGPGSAKRAPKRLDTADRPAEIESDNDAIDYATDVVILRHGASCSAPTHTRRARVRPKTRRGSRTASRRRLWQAQTTANCEYSARRERGPEKNTARCCATQPGYGIVDGDDSVPPAAADSNSATSKTGWAKPSSSSAARQNCVPVPAAPRSFIRTADC